MAFRGRRSLLSRPPPASIRQNLDFGRRQQRAERPGQLPDEPFLRLAGQCNHMNRLRRRLRKTGTQSVRSLFERAFVDLVPLECDTGSHPGRKILKTQVLRLAAFRSE